MLFAMNERGEIKPQMVESYDSSPDKLTWPFVLRDGLKWHDGIRSAQRIAWPRSSAGRCVTRWARC
jgi:MarR-like DNA-binding transcriptional regulator SgrR of sgrS sRNA